MPRDNRQSSAGDGFRSGNLHSPLPHTNHGAGSKVKNFRHAGLTRVLLGKSYPQLI